MLRVRHRISTHPHQSKHACISSDSMQWIRDEKNKVDERYT